MKRENVAATMLFLFPMAFSLQYMTDQNGLLCGSQIDVDFILVEPSVDLEDPYINSPPCTVYLDQEGSILMSPKKGIGNNESSLRNLCAIPVFFKVLNILLQLVKPQRVATETCLS